MTAQSHCSLFMLPVSTFMSCITQFHSATAKQRSAACCLGYNFIIKYAELLGNQITDHCLTLSHLHIFLALSGWDGCNILK